MHLPRGTFDGWHWHPERELFYFCTACRYARLSISGVLRREPSPIHNLAGGKRECSYRVLVLHQNVLHHNAQLDEEGGQAAAVGGGRNDVSRNGESHIGNSQAGQDKAWLVPQESRLVQQAVSPAVFVSEELPEEENYAPAEWAYFVDGKEVCKDIFQKRLDRAYARCRAGSFEARP